MYIEELYVYDVMIQRIDPFSSAALGSSFTSRLPELAVRMLSIPCRGTSASAGKASLRDKRPCDRYTKHSKYVRWPHQMDLSRGRLAFFSGQPRNIRT